MIWNSPTVSHSTQTAYNFLWIAPFIFIGLLGIIYFGKMIMEMLEGKALEGLSPETKDTLTQTIEETENFHSKEKVQGIGASEFYDIAKQIRSKETYHEARLKDGFLGSLKLSDRDIRLAKRLFYDDAGVVKPQEEISKLILAFQNIWRSHEDITTYSAKKIIQLLTHSIPNIDPHKTKELGAAATNPELTPPFSPTKKLTHLWKKGTQPLNVSVQIEPPPTPDENNSGPTTLGGWPLALFIGGSLLYPSLENVLNYWHAWLLIIEPKALPDLSTNTLFSTFGLALGSLINPNDPTQKPIQFTSSEPHSPLTRDQVIETLRKYFWNIRTARDELGINPKTDIKKFLEYFHLEQEFQEILSERLTKEFWALEPVAKSFGITNAVLTKLIRGYNLKISEIDKDYIRKTIAEHNGNLVKAGISIKGRSHSIYKFFEEFELLNDLRKLLLTGIKAGGINAASKMVGLSKPVTQELINAFALTQVNSMEPNTQDPPPTINKDLKNEKLKILDRHGWNILKAGPEIGLKRGEDLYIFFRKNDLEAEIKEKIIQRWNDKKLYGSIGKLSESFGVDQGTMLNLMRGLGILINKSNLDISFLLDEDKEPILPVSEEKAKEISVSPASLEGDLTLFIGVSDDLKTLTYRKVLNDSKVFQTDNSASISFPSSYLLSPERYMQHHFKTPYEMDVLKNIWPRNKRYTAYRGITVTWDKEVDKNVWTTNIDTLFLHKELEDSGLLQKIKIEKAVEIGTGGGHLACLLADRAPNLKELSITDISLYALRAAKRNILNYLKDGTKLRTYLGKGLQTLEGDYDLIVVNPPYIPTSLYDTRPHTDPYRGTGLIREVLEKGIDKLNPKNPEASIVINISSLANKDLEDYLRQFGDRLTIEKIGEPLEVPLKIYSISQSWKDWLVKEGGLQYRPNAPPDQEPYWHTLQTYRIRPLHLPINEAQQISYDDLATNTEPEDDLFQYEALHSAYTPEILKVLQADPTLRPLFLVVLPEKELEPLEIVDHEALKAIGGEKILLNHSAFLAGSAETANQMALRGYKIIVGVSDRYFKVEEGWNIAHGRQVFFPLEDGTWLGVKAIGQLINPDKPPFYLSDDFSPLPGLASEEEAKDAARGYSTVKNSGARFIQTLAYRRIHVLSDGKGNFVSSRGLKDENRNKFNTVLIFNRVLHPHRLAKFEQLLEADPHLTYLRETLSNTLSNLGVLPANKILKEQEWISMIAKELGISEAAKQNEGLGKHSIHSQDFSVAGEEADNEEFLFRGKRDGAFYEGIRKKFETLIDMLMTADKMKMRETYFPKPIDTIRVLFESYFQKLNDTNLKPWVENSENSYPEPVTSTLKYLNYEVASGFITLEPFQLSVNQIAQLLTQLALDEYATRQTKSVKPHINDASSSHGDLFDTFESLLIKKKAKMEFDLSSRIKGKVLNIGLESNITGHLLKNNLVTHLSGKYPDLKIIGLDPQIEQTFYFSNDDRFVSGVVQQMPFTNNEFDAVISFGLFNLEFFNHFVTRPSKLKNCSQFYDQSAKEIKRVLKPGGKFYVFLGVLPNPEFHISFEAKGFKIISIPDNPGFYILINQKADELPEKAQEILNLLKEMPPSKLNIDDIDGIRVGEEEGNADLYLIRESMPEEKLELILNTVRTDRTTVLVAETTQTARKIEERIETTTSIFVLDAQTLPKKPVIKNGTTLVLKNLDELLTSLPEMSKVLQHHTGFNIVLDNNLSRDYEGLSENSILRSQNTIYLLLNEFLKFLPIRAIDLEILDRKARAVSTSA